MATYNLGIQVLRSFLFDFYLIST